ncbi:c-type cytochrome [Ramlibacter sp. AW1]|uniref:C-type cytochrome n=1 Tax=Ramlibacter aurantiacus TaxID=2801330 RepID=A0A936ZE85_9BURK|nr:c-type cytochrome [Ramlibacter aurantiacus]MBL0419949.1 c-type cytochrome [Ramlibacter aurantiacus]
MSYRLLAAALLAMSASAPVLAQAPQNSLYVASLAATCANCHGTQGRAAAASPLPTLAGMPREQMLAQLKAFKDGSRPATVMHQLAKGYSDAQLEQIAGYFAAQKR